MNRLRKVVVSFAEYRPSPTTSGGGVILAVLVGAEAGSICGIAVSGPQEVVESDLASMDGLARELLRRPVDYFGPIVDRHLKNGPAPSSLIRSLSEENNSALCVTDPRELAVDIRLEADARLGDVAWHVGLHVLDALRRGVDPFGLKISGLSGTLVPKDSVALGIEPHIANWANERPPSAPPQARL